VIAGEADPLLPKLAMRRRFCNTPLGQVLCLEAGTGDATPLLLLHQTPRSIDEYAEVAPILAQGRRVVAVDTPGYGASDRVPGQPTVALYADAMTAVLNELGLARAIVVGHHTGALIGFEMAAATPERVERLVLSGPIYMDEAMRAHLRQLFEQWRVVPDGSHLKKKWDAMQTWLARPDLIQRVLVDLLRAGEASEQGHFASAEYRMEDRLKLVRCPALLIFSRRDFFATPESAGPLRAALRPCREAFIDAGVFPANEAPLEFARLILEYVGGPP